MPHVDDLTGQQRAADRRLTAVALHQHGCIAHAQLRRLGLSDRMIGDRVRRGWLVREHRGAYRLAGAPRDGLSVCAAAVLAVGGDTGITHRSALERHAVLPPDLDAPVHVTTAGRRRSRPGIVVHEAALPAVDLVRLDRLPVTTLARSLADAVRTEPATVIAAAVKEAEFLRLLDAGTLAAMRASGPLLRRLSVERLPVAGELREELERCFAVLLRRAHFPTAEVNRRFVLHTPRQVVRLDAVWREAGLAVELDGRQAHATAEAFDADRRRDRRVAVQLGLQVVRVTWRHLRQEPDAVIADLRALYARGLAAETTRPPVGSASAVGKDGASCRARSGPGPSPSGSSPSR